jgi:putative membrane protein (TIGR04086 family)
LAIKEKLSIKLPGGIGPILRGLVVAYLLVVILSIVTGLLFYFTPLSEMWMHPISAGIITLALFFGGRTAAKAAGNKGLLRGITIGIIFIIITMLMSLSKDISWSSLALKSAYALLASAIGGISGVK